MTDISIIGTGCLIVALVIAAGIVVRLRGRIADLHDALALERNGWLQLRAKCNELEDFKRAVERQRNNALKAARAANALAKKAAGR